MKPLFVAAAFFLVVCLLQYSGFHTPLVLDSQVIMNSNVDVFESHDPWKVMTLVPGRPLFMVSLYLNYLVNGMAPFSFRMVNAAILALAGLILVILIVAVLERPDSTVVSMKRQNRVIAVFLGLLFVAHPLQIFVVLYVWQRQAMMACLFHLSALATYISVRSGKVPHVVPAYILTGVLFLAGLMSKENAVSLPAVLAMAELILFRQTYRELVGRIGLIALICVPALVMYTTINGLLTGTETLASHRGFISRLSFFWEISQRGFFEVLLTQCRILFSYLGMIFVPVPEGLPLVYAETVSRSLWDPRSTLAACVGVIGLLGAALGLVRKRPVLSFGILFFVITLVPEAFTVPQFLFFSYRAILPMAGIALILCDICSSLLNWAPNRVARAVVAVCLVALSVYLGSVTLAKAQRWNPLQIWKDDYARLPRLSENVEKRSYVTVLTHYGLALADSGDIATANELFLRAKEIAPLFDFAHLSIGYIRLKQGNLPEATEHFLKVTKLKPKLAEPHYWLGVIKDQQGKLPEAEEHFRKTVELMPRHARAHFALAELTWRQGHVSETITHYQRAIESKPDFFKAYMNLGAVMLRLGRAHEARELFEVSVALRPDRAQAHANLGIASLEVGLIDAAKTHLARALELDPTLALARNYLGAAFERTGETDQAIKLYKGALESDPRLVEAWYNLANLMAKTDNLAVAVKHYQRVLELDPRHHMAHARLGWVFLRTSELDRAVNHLRKALEIQPDLLETRKDLEQAMERLKTVNSPTPLSDY